MKPRPPAPFQYCFWATLQTLPFRGKMQRRDTTKQTYVFHDSFVLIKGHTLVSQPGSMDGVFATYLLYRLYPYRMSHMGRSKHVKTHGTSGWITRAPKTLGFLMVSCQALAAVFEHRVDPWQVEPITSDLHITPFLEYYMWLTERTQLLKQVNVHNCGFQLCFALNQRNLTSSMAF